MTSQKWSSPENRIEGIDIVRGFALFGVLLVNMYNFGATWPIWEGASDKFALLLTQIVFETKSFRLFSFLFGFGVALQMLRAEQRGTAFLPFYLRRMAVLFVLGMANCLLYDGDVLMLYAEFGLILLLVRRAPGSLLVIGWLLLNLVFPVQRAVTAFADGPQPVPSVEERIAEALQNREELSRSHPYSVGTIGDVMALNAEAIPPNPLDETSFLGMCLLGMYAARRRVLQAARDKSSLVKRSFVWGISFGILATLVQQWLRIRFGYSPWEVGGVGLMPQLVGDLCFMFGATALAIGYAAGIMLLARNTSIRRILAPLAAVGRFSLTMYLTQTLMFSMLFYGFAFGQAGQIGPLAVSLYAVAFFSLQLVACAWWARRFQYGPLEWVWRAVSHMRRGPMRINVQ